MTQSTDIQVQINEPDQHTYDPSKQSSYVPDNAGNILSTAMTKQAGPVNGSIEADHIVTVGEAQMTVGQAVQMGFIETDGQRFFEKDTTAPQSQEQGFDDGQTVTIENDPVFDKKASQRIDNMTSELDTIGAKTPSVLAQYMHNPEAMPDMLQPLVDSGAYNEQEIMDGLQGLEADIDSTVTAFWKNLGIKDPAAHYEHLVERYGQSALTAAFSKMVMNNDMAMFQKWGTDYLNQTVAPEVMGNSDGPRPDDNEVTYVNGVKTTKGAARYLKQRQSR